jgi:hypothetical protein
MTDVEMKQLCVDLSKAAIALFDLIEEKGLNAPLEDLDGAMHLKNLIDLSDDIRGYYMRVNLQRMMALGVDPADLLRMAKE